MDNTEWLPYDTVTDTHPESETGEIRVVSNHTGYSHPGGENFEHDDNGSLMNYSGMEDEVYSALATHGDWQEGYDY